MKSLDLVVTYQINTPSDEYWIRLEQEDIDTDIATVEDTASLLDEAFDLNACDTSTTNTTDTTSTTTTTATENSLAEAVSKQFDFSICNTDYDGNLNIKVKVIRSDISEKYKAHITGGAILETTVVNEVITEEYTVDATSSVTMNYPVTGISSFSWMQNSVSTGNNTIKRNGTTLYWKDVSSGTISCTYETTYEVLSVKVYGVNGVPGTATIRVVYHGLVEDLETKTPEWYNTDRESCLYNFDIDFPQKVTCYRTIQKISRCSCSKEEINTEIFDEVVTCPDYAPKKCPGLMPECMHFLGTYTREEYIDCYADNYLPGTSLHTQVSDPDFYENTCCVPVGAVKLPDCEVEVLSYKGGQKLDKGEDFYRSLYGKNAKFVPVGIAEGCGKHIIRQSVGFNNCCDGVVQLTWDSTISPSVMSRDSSATIGIKGGGKYKYTWKVSGEGFVFQNGTKATITKETTTKLITLPTACGTAEVTVSDGCSVATGFIRSNAGKWTMIYQSQAGLMGDPFGVEPYDGPPLGVFPGDGAIGIANWHGQEAIKGQFKVYQEVQGGDGGTYTRSSVATLLAICAEIKSSPPLDPRYFQGQIFTYPSLCQNCGDCSISQPTNLWFNYCVGIHTTINPDPDSSWFTLYSIWMRLIATRVYKWTC